MQSQPRGTVTFLFTDLEGSTRLWRDYRDAMPSAYARHDAILRRAITDHGGVLYKVIGDAVQAAFPTAPAAVAAALSAQQDVQAEPWGACGLPEPLRVRMALHVGSVDPDPDGDYRSPVLNRLGRLLAATHGGQVLLSAAMYGLVWDLLPPGAGLSDLGEHRLKDLEQPSHLFQLLHPDLEEEFPPLRTLAQHPNNLPTQLTAFLGRVGEVAAVQALVVRPEVRLVTLTGPGGIGKSRLSLQASQSLLDDFPDGVWFIELAAITDPALVPQAIAAPIHLRESGSVPLKMLLLVELADKHTLLVLDNFEQVLAAAPLVTELLTGCSNLKVLVTSRIPLRVRGEREFPIAPLALPQRIPPPTLEQVTQYEAVRLFIERAQAVRPDFVIDNAAAPAVAEICHRLDGLPLAIELAAARVRMLDPEALLARLERRLSLLTGGAKDLPERQRTLRQTIAWSYDLLPPEEQALFRCLAVFAGGFTFKAAEMAVAAAPDLAYPDILEGLERLFDQSLLRRVEANGESRFGMLETIREYGLEQLAQNVAEEQAIRRAHALFFADLIVASQVPLFTGTPAAIARMTAERDNVRAMLTWLLEAGETETALRVTTSLSEYWTFTGGQLSEGRAWLERALAEGAVVDPAVRAHALNALGMIATHQGDHPAARTVSTEALGVARAANDLDAVVAALFWLGCGDLFADRAEEALAHTLEALAIARGTDDPVWLGWILWLLGIGQFTSGGDLETARIALEEGLVLSRRLGDTWCEACTLMVLGFVVCDQGEAAHAARLHGESMQVSHNVKLGGGVLDNLIGLSIVAAQTGQPAAAAWLLGAAAAQFDRIGYTAFLDISKRASRIEVDVREQLGEFAFLLEAERGKSLPTEAVIAEAVALAHELARGDPLPLSA